MSHDISHLLYFLHRLGWELTVIIIVPSRLQGNYGYKFVLHGKTNSHNGDLNQAVTSSCLLCMCMVAYLTVCTLFTQTWEHMYTN